MLKMLFIILDFLSLQLTLISHFKNYQTKVKIYTFILIVLYIFLLNISIEIFTYLQFKKTLQS